LFRNFSFTKLVYLFKNDKPYYYKNVTTSCIPTCIHTLSPCFNIMLAVFYACMCLYAHLCMSGLNVVLSLVLFSSVGYGQDMGYGQGKCQIIILFDRKSSWGKRG
jgi:hypothetical protein